MVAIALLIGLLGPCGVRAESSWTRVPTDGEIQSAADRITAGWPASDVPWVTATYKVKTDRPGVDENKVDPLYRAGVIAVVYELPLVRDCTTGTSKQTCVSPFEAYSLGYNKGQWTFSSTGFDSDAQKDTLDSFVQNALSFQHYSLGWPDLSEIASPSAGSGATAEPTPEPELPICAATIYVPAGLKAGDTLSPSADVTSEDGKPIQGTIAEVWTINGTQANSVTWDGKPAQILLQLSCQGHALEVRASYNGTLTRGSTTAVGGEPQGPANSEANGEVPGLDGVGEVPGPADETQGIVGMVGPAVVGILGGLLAGALGGGGGGSTSIPVAPDKSGGADGEESDGEGGEDGPDGEGSDGAGSSGAGPDGMGTGGKEGTPPGGKGPGGKEPGGSTPTAPGVVSPATKAAIDKPALATGQASATGNAAAKEGVSKAQDSAFDASGGKPDPIRDNLTTSDKIFGSDPLPMGIPWVNKSAESMVNGVSSFFSSAKHGLAQLGDAALHPIYFVKGVDAACRNVAPAEAKAADSAFADGRYVDAFGASAKGTAKVAAKLFITAHDMSWNIQREMLPIDEIKTFFAPDATLSDRYAAYQGAQLKVAAIILPELLGAAAEVKGAAGAHVAHVAHEAAEAHDAIEAGEQIKHEIEGKH